MAGLGAACCIWVVRVDGERVKAFDSEVAALRYMVCLSNCDIAVAQMGLKKTIQFASGRRGYVLSYVCVFRKCLISWIRASLRKCLIS